MSTSTELKDQNGPKIVIMPLVSVPTKPHFPLQRWQRMYVTCITTAAIFTAQKLAQQEFNSIKFHYSEKGNSVLTSEKPQNLQKGSERTEKERAAGEGRRTRTSCPGHPDRGCTTPARQLGTAPPALLQRVWRQFLRLSR